MKKRELRARVAELKTLLAATQEQLSIANSDRLLMGESIKNYMHQLKMANTQLTHTQAELENCKSRLAQPVRDRRRLTD